MIYAPEIEPAVETDLEMWAADGKTCVMLCDIGNDHNLGAIVRSAAFFDVEAVIITEGTELTTSAYRVAEGGMEYVYFRRIGNPAAFLHDASRVLTTVAADTRARIRIRDLPGVIATQNLRHNKSGKGSGVILVLGNEEKGLPSEVLDACSIRARIPGTGLVDSLNVAQAASLFLQELYER
jgi:TrmH RNA methyltransferase